MSALTDRLFEETAAYNAAADAAERLVRARDEVAPILRTLARLAPMFDAIAAELEAARDAEPAAPVDDAPVAGVIDLTARRGGVA
jgi:hypothetical protein